MKEQLGTQILNALYKNSEVCFKGIGKLQLIYQSSSVDLENKWLLPPEIWYSFTPDRECPLDQQLIELCSRIWNSSLDSMYDYLETEMARLRLDLRERGSCSIHSLGTFYSNAEGDIYFLPGQKNPLKHMFFGLPSLALPAESVKIEEPAEELSLDSPSVKTPQIVKIQPRVLKPRASYGPLIAGILVLILTAIILFIVGLKRNQIVRPQPVVLEQSLDKKINVSPAPERPDSVQLDSMESTDPESDYSTGNQEIQNRLQELDQCIIIVGAFNRQSNVDKMIYLIVQESAFKPIVLEGQLTRVGFTFDCDGESWKEKLKWARETFNEEAWLYKN